MEWMEWYEQRLRKLNSRKLIHISPTSDHCGHMIEACKILHWIHYEDILEKHFYLASYSRKKEYFFEISGTALSRWESKEIVFSQELSNYGIRYMNPLCHLLIICSGVWIQIGQSVVNAYHNKSDSWLKNDKSEIIFAWVHFSSIATIYVVRCEIVC